MPADLVIRPVEPADEPDWRRLWTAYLAFYQTTVPEEVYRSTFDRILRGGDYEPRGLLAFRAGEAIGLVHYFFHRHCWKVENVCYLQDLYAAPSARGCGVGRALIEAVYAAADEAGCPSVYWMTQEFNQTARLLYDRIGQLVPFVKYQRP
ncbi:MAG: GNAT family N-acetyltransferase [Pararhizobium sp.]